MPDAPRCFARTGRDRRHHHTCHTCANKRRTRSREEIRAPPRRYSTRAVRYKGSISKGRQILFGRDSAVLEVFSESSAPAPLAQNVVARPASPSRRAPPRMVFHARAKLEALMQARQRTANAAAGMSAGREAGRGGPTSAVGSPLHQTHCTPPTITPPSRLPGSRAWRCAAALDAPFR